MVPEKLQGKGDKALLSEEQQVDEQCHEKIRGSKNTYFSYVYYVYVSFLARQGEIIIMALYPNVNAALPDFHLFRRCATKF